MKTKKLRLHLAKFKNTVEMRVLEQEGVDNQLLAESEHVAVASYPSMRNVGIYLRGDDYIRDNDMCGITFYTEKEASQYMEKVIGWLDEVFYNGTEELNKGDKVLLGSSIDETAFFISDLGEDVNGRYVTAKSFEKGKYIDLVFWHNVRKLKQSGYNPNTKEYYGEINED